MERSPLKRTLSRVLTIVVIVGIAVAPILVWSGGEAARDATWGVNRVVWIVDEMADNNGGGRITMIGLSRERLYVLSEKDEVYLDQEWIKGRLTTEFVPTNRHFDLPDGDVRDAIDIHSLDIKHAAQRLKDEPGISFLVLSGSDPQHPEVTMFRDGNSQDLTPGFESR